MGMSVMWKEMVSLRHFIFSKVIINNEKIEENYFDFINEYIVVKNSSSVNFIKSSCCFNPFFPKLLEECFHTGRSAL